MIQERQTEVLIKYLLVKKFSYHDPQEAESMSGHPLPGRIYRSVYNVNTKHHRLLLPDGVVMGFNQLTGTSEAASFELVEITLENILDHDIVEEDFAIFHHPNDDIFFEPKVEIIGLEALQQKIGESMHQEIDFSQRASHAVLSLYQANPAKAEILVELAEYLNDKDLEASTDISNWMRYHHKGSFVNIAKALTALDRYTGENKRTNEAANDLFEALEAIVVELERIYTN